MNDMLPVFATAAVIIIMVASQVLRRGFDPFEPLWLFLAGYAQVYVVQALSYRDYAMRVRGDDIVTQANLRALWALLWFLAVYHSGLGKMIARRLPRAPAGWLVGPVVIGAPVMVAWGLVCSGLVLSRNLSEISAEENLLRQFPMMMLVGGVLLLVTGRQPSAPRPGLTAAGLAVAAAYVVIWTFNGKRSHSVFGVLTGICAFYVPRFRRPSLPLLGALAFVCTLVVSLALGWRGTTRYENTPAGFLHYLSEFDLANILVNLNMKERSEVDADAAEQLSKETEEYGGFLLMMDTVPDKAAYDYGASYLRLVSTFIPRLVWPNKPIFGREEWVNAWIAGSEFRRDGNFTGPAIGVLGATQLNGGAVATAIVMAALALLIRTAYDYFRYHAATPWAQAWWALTYYNAWLMTVNDDPFVWFYYIYGYSILPPMAMLWLANRRAAAPAGARLVPGTA